MRYVRDVTKATTGIVLLAFACSGKKEQPPTVAVFDDAAVDSSPPDAAPPPFVVTRKTSTFGSFILVEQSAAKCPTLEWRTEPKTLRIGRCLDTPLAEQADTLRAMHAYLRTLEPVGDDLRIVGLGDFYSYPELARRFVTYAKTHPYTSKVGIHAWVKQAANSGDMMPELAVIFQRRPRLSSVEKCWAGRATSQTDEGKFIREAGGTGNAEIPLGCSMTTFELVPP
jgi:hypothetical protein